MIEAVLFDLDGTLIDSAPTIGTILNGIRLQMGKPQLPLSEYPRLMSLGVEVLVTQVLDLQVHEISSAIAEFRRLYENVRTPIESLVPGASMVLHELQEMSIACGLVSNKPEYLCLKILAETDLLHLFRTIVGGDTTSRVKPRAEPLLCAAANLRASTEATIYVGDSSIDQLAANLAGMRFVLYNSTYETSVSKNNIWGDIDRLDQLVPLIQRQDSMTDKLQ
jgi:phosphoglycolate phosphatase